MPRARDPYSVQFDAQTNAFWDRLIMRDTGIWELRGGFQANTLIWGATIRVFIPPDDRPDDIGSGETFTQRAYRRSLAYNFRRIFCPPGRQPNGSRYPCEWWHRLVWAGQGLLFGRPVYRGTVRVGDSTNRPALEEIGTGNSYTLNPALQALSHPPASS